MTGPESPLGGAANLRLPSSSRRWVVGLVVLALLGGALAVLIAVTRPGRCGAEKVEARSPLLSAAGMVEQPDDRLDTLAAAVDGWGPPFGEVRAGAGYDYDQWLSLYGVSGGLLAWTKNNAPVTLLDGESLRPRWTLRPTSARTAWDASEDAFVLLDLEAEAPTTIAAFDLADGDRRWCRELDPRHDDGDPVATSFTGDGLLVALPGGDGLAVSLLDADSGEPRWERELTGVDRGDYLGALGEDTFLLGGSEEYRLAEERPSTPGGPVISAFSTEDGDPVWSWTAEPNEIAHVVGIDGGQVQVVVRSADGVRLLALDVEDGEERWQRETPGGAFEATLRSGVLLMRTPARLDALDAADGEPRWQREVPTGETYFPYGFTLGQMPSLDAERVLMPTTSALRILDLDTGEDEAYPLPTDGISTTYWPYQLAVTEGLVAVVTNTGGVVADRD